ncbi:MAG: ATP-binding cassette domain-containing protein [Pseudonocardia sp.]
MTAPASRVTGNAPIIEVDRLSRRFKQFEAVSEVSFDVRPGELFGFLGPNGAGKTTTINMLTTLLTPSSGTARVNGYDVVRERSEVRRSIGLVFQQPTLDEYLSAEQNLRFHGYAYGVDAALRERRMTELLEMVELDDRRSGSVRTFSGGMKRRLEIARGLLHHPSVLFLDEPTLGLDPQTRHRIWDYLHALREQEGLTIFLTTHYMDEAEHCDRIAVIDHGRIAGLDTPDGLKHRLGGDLVILQADDNAATAREVRETYGLPATVQDGRVSFHVPYGEEFLPGFVRRIEAPLTSIGVRRPTLEDVFLDLTGHEIRDSELDEHDLLLQQGGRR